MNNFKKILIAVAAFAMTTTAQAHDRRHEDRRYRGPSIEVIIAEAIISTAERERRYQDYRYENRGRYEYRYQPRPTECWRVRAYDYYGRPYLKTVCER